MNPSECRLPKTHKEIVRIMVFSIPYLKDGQATSNTKARAPLPGFSRVIWDEWGKKGVRMDTKALKKQMGAAIAMVLVAAVALGSATFAWFVTNNKVDATTSTISAQSNTAFMYIREKNSDDQNHTTWTSTVDSAVGDKALYPAHWALETESGTGKPYAAAGSFYTAFGTAADNGAMKGTSISVGNPDTAVAGQYAVKNTFRIGSKGSTLKDLVVASASLGTAGNAQFDKPLRVLVKNGDNWVLCGYKDQDNSFTILGASNATNMIAPKVDGSDEAKEVVVNMYVFYDGDEAEAIKTNNLSNLKDAAKAITVNFRATSEAKNHE